MAAKAKPLASPSRASISVGGCGDDSGNGAAQGREMESLLNVAPEEVDSQ